MSEHPCAKGLTKSCFAAYPTWARQALAYKLLHILLPKQLTKKLPGILRQPLIAPGVILPPGVELPPGAIVAPGVSFPPGWAQGDPLPPGAQLPLPIFPYPTEVGPAPPLYVQPWEPGPVHGTLPSPSTSGWTQILSDAYWDPVNYGHLNPMMSWNGTKWLVLDGGSSECFNWPQLIPKAGTTWAVGYRPTQARITFIGGIAPIKIGFCATGGTLLAHNLNSVSPQVFDLDFSSGKDIYQLDTTNIGMSIMNIEFKEA